MKYEKDIMGNIDEQLCFLQPSIKYVYYYSNDKSDVPGSNVWFLWSTNLMLQWDLFGANQPLIFQGNISKPDPHKGFKNTDQLTLNNYQNLSFNMMVNFLGFKHLKLARQSFILRVLRKLNFDFTINRHIPDIDKLRTKYLYLKMTEHSFKDFVCNELIEECNIVESSFYLQGFEKKYLITMDIEILKKHGLIKPSTDQMSLVNGLLNYLDPFPFDSKHMSLFKSQPPSHCLTIKFLRDSIEKQYLAWKYNVDLQQISDILFRLQPCLFTCRSLRNLRRNCAILDMVPSFRNKSLSKKIYLINQQPFSVPLVLNFNKCLPYLNWDLFSSQGYRTLQCSFSQIYFIIKILENKGFISKQIQEIVPFLYLNFDTFINRMNVILSHPVLSQHLKHDKFLHLLLYPTIYLMNLDSMNFHSLEDLKDAIKMIHSKMKLSRSQQITINSIKYHTSHYFRIDSEHLNIIKRHPKYSLVTEHQLGSTLRFLKKSGFSRAEVLESIIIILYPRRIIVNALKKMTEEDETLNKLGFVNGYVPEETNFIKAGTKSRRKTLQLCLYYIEKQFNFSWDGVLNLSTKKSDKDVEY